MAISLIFVLMYLHRKNPSGVKCGERAAQEIEPPLPIHLPSNFSFNYVRMQRKRLNNKMIVQQDGASPHFSKEVRTWLNKKFDGRWIGRDGSIS